MRFFILISLILFFNNCSFDNKTGIWKNNDSLIVNKKDKDLFEDFRKITVSEGVFNKEIPLEDKSQIKLKKSINNYNLKYKVDLEKGINQFVDWYIKYKKIKKI